MVHNADNTTSTLCKKTHKKERKCAPVQYKLCEENAAEVPVLLKVKLWVPKFSGCVKIVKDKDGKCAKLCTEVEGWELCSTTEHVIKGRLTQKIYGPHFLEKKCTSETDTKDDA